MNIKPFMPALVAFSAPMLALSEGLPIIPKPAGKVRLDGHFAIGPDTVVRSNPRLRAEAGLFAADQGERLGREVRTVDEQLHDLRLDP